MSQEEMVKGLTYLGTVYNKEYTKLECEIHYDFLKAYNYGTFIVAIKSIIKKSKFLPKVNELIDECESCKTYMRYEILDYMKERGYFKEPFEYEKASKFLESGIIPEWFRKDMTEYYSLMNSQRLEQSETKMIGGQKGD